MLGGDRTFPALHVSTEEGCAYHAVWSHAELTRAAAGRELARSEARLELTAADRRGHRVRVRASQREAEFAVELLADPRAPAGLNHLADFPGPGTNRQAVQDMTRRLPVRQRPGLVLSQRRGAHRHHGGHACDPAQRPTGWAHTAGFGR